MQKFKGTELSSDDNNKTLKEQIYHGSETFMRASGT